MWRNEQFLSHSKNKAVDVFQKAAKPEQESASIVMTWLYKYSCIFNFTYARRLEFL